MSFILDALRKSEHERERKTLPGLVDAPVVRADRPKVPIAMLAIGALLAVNLLVLLFVLLRDSGSDDAPAPAAVQTATPGAAGAPAADSSAAGPRPAASASAEVRPLQAEAGTVDDDVPAYVDTPPIPRDPALDGGARVSRSAGVVFAPQPLDDTRPLSNAERNAAAAAGLPVEDGVPSINDLAPQATAGLPPLAINLHVYTGDPKQSFVVLNGRRYQAGAQLQEGPQLERITPAGVILNHRGLRFLLPSN